MTTTVFEPVRCVKQIDDETRAMALAEAIGFVSRLTDAIDFDRGRGIIGDDSECVWTKTGHRITFSVDATRLCITVSVDPDAEAGGGGDGRGEEGC
jgi:hypothetical protein